MATQAAPSLDSNQILVSSFHFLISPPHLYGVTPLFLILSLIIPHCHSAALSHWPPTPRQVHQRVRILVGGDRQKGGGGRSVIGGCQLPLLAMDTAFTAAAIATGLDSTESRLQQAAGMELSLLWFGFNLHGHSQIFALARTQSHSHTLINDKLAHTHEPLHARKSNQIFYLYHQAVLEKTFSSFKIDEYSMLAAINCCIIRLTSYLLKQFREYKSWGIYKNHLIMSHMNFKDVLLQALFGQKLAIQSPSKMFPILIKWYMIINLD